MKSMLKEASSIGKAVQEAWQEAGKPEEFTIKVFDVGKRSFFGFTKRPAVISIIYDPRTRGRVSRPKKTAFKTAPKVSARTSQSPTREDRRGEGVTRKTGRGDAPNWDSNYMMDMSRWLKDMIDIIGADRTFTLSVDRQTLKILFNKPVVKDIEQERMLFSSFAYVLMQFLKRKYKSKFRGLRIAISANR